MDPRNHLRKRLAGEGQWKTPPHFEFDPADVPFEAAFDPVPAAAAPAAVHAAAPDPPTAAAAAVAGAPATAGSGPPLPMPFPSHLAAHPVVVPPTAPSPPVAAVVPVQPFPTAADAVDGAALFPPRTLSRSSSGGGGHKRTRNMSSSCPDLAGLSQSGVAGAGFGSHALGGSAGAGAGAGAGVYTVASSPTHSRAVHALLVESLQASRKAAGGNTQPKSAPTTPVVGQSAHGSPPPQYALSPAAAVASPPAATRTVVSTGSEGGTAGDEPPATEPVDDEAAKKARRLARNRASARARRERKRLRMERLQRRIDALESMIRRCRAATWEAVGVDRVRKLGSFDAFAEEPLWEGPMLSSETHWTRLGKLHGHMRSQLEFCDFVRQEHFGNEVLILVARASQYGSSNPVLRELVDLMQLSQFQAQRIGTIATPVALEANEITALAKAVLDAVNSKDVLMSSDPTVPKERQFMHFPLRHIANKHMHSAGMQPDQVTSLMVWANRNRATIAALTPGDTPPQPPAGPDVLSPTAVPPPDMPVPASVAASLFMPHPKGVPPTAAPAVAGVAGVTPPLVAAGVGGSGGSGGADAASLLHTSISGDLAQLALINGVDTSLSPLTPDLDFVMPTTGGGSGVPGSSSAVAPAAGAVVAAAAGLPADTGGVLLPPPAATDDPLNPLAPPS